MRIFRRLIIVVFLCSVSAQGNTVTDNKAFRSFWHPTYLGERLSYCTLDGAECGNKVANQYCRLLGYDKASQSTIAYNVGLTHFIATRAQCKGWRCNGFTVINCITNLTHKPTQAYHYTEKKFAYPRFKNYRVDWCYEHNKRCGRDAAYSFCNRIGYMNVKQFAKEEHVGATKTIGSQELCFGEECNAFKQIVCTR